MNYIIENENLKVEVSELGATLVRFIEKKTQTDVVLGFDSDDDYIKNNSSNIGATIGRNANRIGNAKFVLNGKEYQLTVNDNMNQLHGGGPKGFAFKKWSLEKKTADEVVLSYLSKDGEEGFPGNLKVFVSYKLDGNSLIYSFTGESDEDTLLNITNHSYFNLGAETILDHELRITSDKYSPTDNYALTLDEVKDVKGTDYDFTEFVAVKERVKDLPQGIDNNYVWENIDDKLCCELKYSNLQLNIYSDLPDMHLYTAYHLKTDEGKYNHKYGSYGGIALECQYYPNGINYGDKYLLPILRKGEKMRHYIKYELKKI